MEWTLTVQLRSTPCSIGNRIYPELVASRFGGRQTTLRCNLCLMISCCFALLRSLTRTMLSSLESQGSSKKLSVSLWCITSQTKEPSECFSFTKAKSSLSRRKQPSLNVVDTRVNISLATRLCFVEFSSSVKRLATWAIGFRLCLTIFFSVWR